MRSLHWKDLWKVQGPRLPIAAPLPALVNRFLVRRLEPEHDSGRNAQIVLGIRCGSRFREPGHQVIHLNGPNREVIGQLVIHAATYGHGKGVVRIAGPRHARVSTRHTEENFAKRGYAPEATNGNARPEQIRGKRSARAGVQDIAAVIAAEIRNTAEPALRVVSDRRAAPVEAEAAHARSARIIAHIRIARENIDLRRVLRMSARAEKRKNRQ